MPLAADGQDGNGTACFEEFRLNFSSRFHASSKKKEKKEKKIQYSWPAAVVCELRLYRPKGYIFL